VLTLLRVIALPNRCLKASNYSTARVYDVLASNSSSSLDALGVTTHIFIRTVHTQLKCVNTLLLEFPEIPLHPNATRC